MKNPFHSAETAPRDSSPSPGPPQQRRRWVAIRGALLGTTLLVTASFLVIDLWIWRDSAAHQSRALQQAHAALTTLTRQARQFREERDTHQEALRRAEAEQRSLADQVKDLKLEHQKTSDAQRRLEAEMRAALESRDVTISELAGKLTVNILDRVLFDSGDATIKEEGQAVLRQVAAILDEFPDRQIQVIGHTDNVPINTPRFPSNWELSAARALAAVRFLTEEAGVHPDRVGALAHGEFHPVADNSIPEGRAQNRRIAIVVLPEILTREPSRTPSTDTGQEPLPTDSREPPREPAGEDPRITRANAD